MAALECPIIVDEHGDVSVYSGPDQAAAGIEPIDVRNGEYRFYDATGLVLQAEVFRSRSDGRIRRLLIPPTERIRVFAPAQRELRADELASTLRRFLIRLGPERVGATEQEVKSAELALLVEFAAKFMSE